MSVKKSATAPDARSAAIAKMIELREAGQKWPAVLAATGLNHVVAEQEWMRHQFVSQGGVVIELNAANVKHLRDDQQLSWGEIAARTGARTAAPVYRLYKEATGNLSSGLRIGRGGRFLGGDPELYAGTLQPTGTTISAEVGRAGARLAAFQQRLVKFEMADLKQFAADHGVAVKKGWTKAQIVGAIAKGLGGEVPALQEPAVENVAS